LFKKLGRGDFGEEMEEEVIVEVGKVLRVDIEDNNRSANGEQRVMITIR
jgi:hypothetical protein